MINENNEPQAENEEKNQLVYEVLEGMEQSNSELILLGGVLGGIVAAVLINPIAGAFLLAGTVGTSILGSRQRGSDRMKVLTGEVSPVAYMNADQMKSYKQIIGEDNYTLEMRTVVEAGEKLVNVSKDVKEAAYQMVLESDFKQVNPIEQLSLYSRASCLILGRSGDGKDMWVSNTLRDIKKTGGVRVYVVDPKGTDHEKTYYEGVADVYQAFKSGSMSDAEVVDNFKKAFEQFLSIQSDTWLLVITESTLVGDAFSRTKDNYLAEKISKLVTTGNADKRNLWMMAQVTNLANLGIDSNARGQFPTFAVCHRKNIDNAVNSWGKYGTLGKIKTEVLRLACKTSPRERCFYSPNVGEWLPMPELPNYSGYDRDKFTKTTAIAPTPTPQEIKDTHQSERHENSDWTWGAIALELRKTSTTDIVEFLKNLYPDVPNNRLNEVIAGIKAKAMENGDNDIISKFSL
ncbi:MAG: hypothetical protein KME60_03480 [Cyanomargarita calcarea GSE-NOS-MK-12-04C]|jgi:hypothetical protein|uniref:Uncharacterized protein n=1 Tax=Cyanomargarita calcarea GSE-NOS-MK-12-04C TaxID=2839659 RepID=A0A951QK68_9CYAN|nr:hypothetical protein [Cyanomargarita calcarea GSE-NOS-MK-12-04C]